MHLHPQGGGKNLGVIYMGKFVSAPQHPKCTPSRARVNFIGHFFAGRGRFGGGSGLFSSFRPSFEGNVNFLRKKVHPQTILRP